MAAVTVIDNPDATLYWHPASKIVHHEFHTYVTGPAFQDILSRGQTLMEQQHAAKWLSDDRQNSALAAADATWAQTVWFPAVKKAGWKHWAVVMPAKVLGQLNMKQWVSMYSGLGINARMFTEPEAALSWLEQQ